MIGIELKDFQEIAVANLREHFFHSDNQTIVFSAPTGSGKTVMLIALMDSIIENNPLDYDFAFVWLTPGNGELEEQSYKSTLDKASLVRPQMLQDALTSGFAPNSVTFINWEQVTKKGNIATRNGEVRNISDRIEEAKESNIHFIIIVDEEHRNKTIKTDSFIDGFNASRIIRTSATPQSSGTAYNLVQVNEDDVIRQGMITRNVVLNLGVSEGDIISDPVTYFLDLADEKRREIKNAYQELDKNINPLVLIQLPDEKTGKVNKDYMLARGELISSIEDYLKELGQQENQVARWLSGDHFNIEAIEKNDSDVNYLLMKQAVSTGWDVPRAKILVTLRVNMEVNFTLQTIGRVRRMPEQKHYENYSLDNSFIFSNDVNYINEVLDKGEGVRIAQYTLNSDVTDFNLISLKPNEFARPTIEEITKMYWSKFKDKYQISQDKNNFEKLNIEKLKAGGYDFSTEIKQKVPVSDRLLLDVETESLRTVTTRETVSPRKNRLTLLDREQDIQKYLHVSSTSDTHSILVELFSERGEGIFVPPILRLKNLELTAFIINNYKKLRDDAKEMDTNNLNLFDSASDMIDHVKFMFPKFESYRVKTDTILQSKIMKKNVYEGYSEANWVGQSTPEKLFEQWLEKSEKVKWWYRNFDRGERYFSVAFGAKKEGFFPDYLVQDINGKVYICETKGGKNADIDDYSEIKFYALKDYVESFAKDKTFAFVRPDRGRLLYSNTEYDKDLNNPDIWKAIENLFE